MNREIDKLMALREMVSEEEKKFVDETIDMLSDTFKNILIETRIYIITGVREERDYSEVINAMSKIKMLADNANNGLEFPILKTDKDARVYLVKYGKEVIMKN